MSHSAVRLRLRPVFVVGSLLACALPIAFEADTARAGWPPPETATSDDLSKPENWPNDPDYAYDENSNGQWNYYSFMVQPNQARPEETATGMSIDLAWRYTQGDPSVVIAITDSGVKWDERDIIEAAFINHRELAAHKPTMANGTACADLDPDFYPGEEAAKIAAFDCNGDGVLTVADYAETPVLTPPMAEGRPLGDRNRNGVLDAGDLIGNFSDGIDDDANGYVDDISGWDFFMDDNDPYDDTRYGHGTGEARDSTSRANNGIGSAGGCNQCRVLSLRVGDSFITDVTDFGQAVAYATDMRVKIVQSALGTVNMNKLAQEALDYAWKNGVLTIASMADENSRHHNMPTASNHTLPVHAIQYSGEGVTSAKTFLQYHPCSNYGGQNFLSASGTGCSSEATGQLSGITGLVFSAGKKYGVNLEPGEVMQILMMGADDIDVDESRQPMTEYRYSQPGFDQRFGYGRANANTAVEMVKDGKIPPVVDIVSPTWFTVLYKDQVLAPIDIQGTISAKRAVTYDYVAEWGAGVQPLEGQFKEFASQKNLPPETVVGADGPIASLDIRTIDPTHEADIDSLLGENKYAITVRVRATAHYGGSIGDVVGELRRTYYVHSDPDLVRGFPIYMGAGGESSPKMSDLDGDGVRELIYPTAAGELHVYKITSEGPVELPGFPFKSDFVDGLRSDLPGVADYSAALAYQPGGIDKDIARESMTTGAPAIADVDGDGSPDIVVATYPGSVYVIDANGDLKPGWPKRLPRVPSCSLDPDNPVAQPCMSEDTRIARGTFAAPVLEDMDKDGDLEIIQSAFDGKVYIWHADGTDLDGFPVDIDYKGSLGGVDPPSGRVFTTPAVADFNGDGIPEILVGSNQKLGEGGGSGAVYLVDGRGNNAPGLYMPNWPITMTSLNLFPLVAEGVTNSAVIGNVGGKPAAIFHGNGSPPLILPLDPGKQEKLNITPPNALPEHDDPFNPGTLTRGLYLSGIYGERSKAPVPDTMLPLFSQPSLGDMDQDGEPEVIASGGSLSLAIAIQSSSAGAGVSLLSMWSTKTGKMMPASPMIIEDFTFFNSSSVADLTGDGYPEALIGSGGYYVHAYDACGREPEGFPKFTGQWVIPTPAIGDIDGDKKLEIVTGSRDGYLYAWHTDAPDTNLIEWESYHHDNRNTGNLNVKLDQGGPRTASKPLTVEMCDEAIIPEPTDDGDYYLGGGCTCTLASDDANEGVWAAFALGLSIAARRRRREVRANG